MNSFRKKIFLSVIIFSLFFVGSVMAGEGGFDFDFDFGDFDFGDLIESPAPTASLSASPTSVNLGLSSQITWSSTDATSCSGTGFLTNNATSGIEFVVPNLTTIYTVTCTGSGGSANDTATVSITEVDISAAEPTLKSGSIFIIGDDITFESLITNIGDGDLSISTATYFDLDIGNDGSYDLTLTSNSLSTLIAGQSIELESSSWTTVVGTHAVRAVVPAVVPDEPDESGCFELTFDPGIGGELDTGSLQEFNVPSGEVTIIYCPSDYDTTIISGGETSIETNTSNNTSPEFIFTVSEPQCNDGIDNDGDGDIDYPNDVACGSSGDDSEGSPTQCADGIDNDGDTLVDLADAACSGSSDNDEGDDPQCADGIDNDGDTLVDLADRGCVDFRDTDESDEGALNPSVDITTIPLVSLIRAGDSITVIWTASDITSCTVTGPSLSRSYSESPVSDQASVTINNKSTYTINCDSEGIQSSDSVTIGVVPAFDEI